MPKTFAAPRAAAPGSIAVYPVSPLVSCGHAGSTHHGRAPQRHAIGLALRALGWLSLPWIALAGNAAAQSAPATGSELDRVEVIGTSPLPGQGIDRNLLPYSTQLIKRSEIDQTQAVNLTDFLNRRVVGVQVNDIQGSPFQGDLTYRGFRASPLIGAGQGLSVYLDGVRINEPFGDVVNFDLIPEFAVDTISLVPGANPAFGLNSLGGALAYTTHTGATAPGVRADLSLGSFGRKRVDVSYGHADDASGWQQYVAATGFDENGWRDASAGHLGQVFAKLGRDLGDTSWSVSLLGGRSTLVGNGLIPAYTLDDGEHVPDLYATRRESVYTYPDRTVNKLGQVAFNGRHQLDADSSLSVLAYVRHTRRDTVNGDTADDDAPVTPPTEDPDDDDDNPEPTGTTAAFNSTRTRQTGYGAGVSYATKTGPHQWQVGASLDKSHVRYTQSEQEGFFTADRGVIAAEGEPVELSANVDGKSTTAALYATDTWELAPRTHLTGTARYNHSTVENTLTTRDDDSGEVESKPSERFTYNSVNPALGIAHRLGEAQTTPTVFANVARNTRVPTVIELGCADPDEPCRLPAGLQSDPFLKQVKSTTAEAGLRWPITPTMRFNVEAYRTTNKDDILFRSVNVSGQLGYFANFPKTRNQGVDSEFAFTLGTVDIGLGYSFLDATYQADGVLRQGERNVVITPGTRIAGVPRHTLKAAADWHVGQGFSIGADLVALTSRGVAGNEDGLLEDPEDDEAPQAEHLRLPGYAVLNLRANWKPSAQWELYVTLNNAFDRRYENYGALAETVFDAQGAYTGDSRNAVFVAPGTPRNVQAGVRLRF